MAINQVVTLHEGDDLYNYCVDKIKNASDDDLVIIARGDKNRKDGKCPPIYEKHNIYFYVAYKIEDALAFITSPTDEQIAKAKQNMINSVRMCSMFTFLSGMGSSKTIDSWEYDESDPMVIVTTEGFCNGAGVLYCNEIFHELYSKMGDYYILPSSIHELIIIKKAYDTRTMDLSGLVHSVNNDTVSDHEYLADEAFNYLDWA